MHTVPLPRHRACRIYVGYFHPLRVRRCLVRDCSENTLSERGEFQRGLRPQPRIRGTKDLSSRRRASELGDRVCILCLPPDFSAVPHYSVHTQLSLRPSQNRACAINAHGSSQCLSHAIPAGICMLCDVVSWPLYSLRLSAAGVSPHRLTLCRLLSSGGVTRLLRYYETIRLPMPDKLRLPC